MCAPELNFLDYGLPHFQTCPLLCLQGEGMTLLNEYRIFLVGKGPRPFRFSLNRAKLSCRKAYGEKGWYKGLDP
jgi:hypothetical protein